jgi:hypothetical protein
MNKKTAKALEKSIAHWRRMHDAESPEDLGKESPYGDYCALCDLFSGKDCEGCPVAIKTGKTECDGSPWANARDFFGQWKSGWSTRAEWRKAARKEITFLESLRETA